MRKRTFTGLVAMPLVTGALLIGSATAASAAPSDNSSCVAQLVNGPFGPPGQEQRGLHAPQFGQGVSFVARFPRDYCAILATAP